MKTEVILIQNIVGLGAESDHVKVAPGYARNYLFPQRLAIPLTAANKRQIEVLRQRRAEREAHEFNTMSELSRGISKLTCVVKVKTGDDGKMFGSVTSGTIADELKHQFDISLDKRKIHLDHPIKVLGEHDIELRLHPEVTATLKVQIESLTPPPVAPEAEKGAPAREGGPGGPRTEKRGRRFEARGERTERAPEKAEKTEKGHPAKGPREPRAPRTARPSKPAKPEKAE